MCSKAWRGRGGGGEQGEREQSVNILTGTHKEPVLGKNLIQDQQEVSYLCKETALKGAN